MKYTKISTKQNIISYNAQLDAFCYKKEGEYFLFYQEKEYNIPQVVNTIRLHKDTLFLRYNSGECDKLINGDLIKINKKVDLEIISGDYLKIYYFNQNDYQTYSNLLNIKTDIPILKNNIPYELYSENNVIFAYDNFKGEFKRINTNTETLWQFPLLSLGGSEYEPNETDKINKILGIAHGNVWFYTHFGRLVALELETGNIAKKISGNPSDQNSSYEMTLGLGDCFFRNLDKNIISISGFDFQIIDTKTLTISEQYNFLQADPMGIGAYRSVFSPLLQGDYFTFLGEKEKEYGGIGWVGIFDYKARKLLWEYEIISQEERNATRNQLVISQPLYMSDNKLYIKDIKDNLHIFEREEKGI